MVTIATFVTIISAFTFVTPFTIVMICKQAHQPLTFDQLKAKLIRQVCLRGK